MTKKKRYWLTGVGAFVILGIAVLFIAGHILAGRWKPYIRAQAIQYMEDRFDSKVELADLDVQVSNVSPLKALLSRGHGVIASVEGRGVAMRLNGRLDVPPLFTIKRFNFNVDLGTLYDATKTVNSVTVEGMQINIPPKGQRPQFGSDKTDETDADTGESNTDVVIDEVIIMDSALTILPRDSAKIPLRFDLHSVRLESAGLHVAMKYTAALTNAKPPGEIHSTGNFGPWVADEPGDTPLSGEYDFDDADLGVFAGIAGILDSTGQFEGSLASIDVKGEASVPNFQLKQAGNPVSLSTTFEVLVDGTNGNTILKPVVGKLGTTKFTTSGAVIKHEEDKHRTIGLDVTMPDGDLRDVLRLAMKGAPFMEGRLYLKSKIDLPPLEGKVRERLLLDGQFKLSKARFLTSKVQDQIDSLSRRGQGQPKNEGIVEVVSGMAGTFKLHDEVMTFRALSFAVPGAGVDLAGSYDMDKDILDFHGSLKLQAKVSETMTGWKRWLLKPVDPFFSKEGAGTLLRIQVVGSSTAPQFGRDRGKPTKVAAGSGKEK